MFGSQTKPAAPATSSPRAQATHNARSDEDEKKERKPTEPFWKTTDSLRPVDAPALQGKTIEPQSASPRAEADVRTLIIGPGVSVKGEITSCNRLIVEGKIEAKLADCPNVIIKQGGIFNGESTTEEADVQGSFDGILVARKRLVVRATGRVSGKIAYGEIEIESGGKIAGEISHNEDSAAASPLKHQVA